MKNILRLILVGSLMISVSGCNKKPPQAKVLDHFKALAEIMTENKDDCVKAAEGISEWSAKNGQVISELKAEIEQLSSEKKAELKEKYQGRMKIVTATIMRATLKCAKEPKFAEAMKSVNIK